MRLAALVLCAALCFALLSSSAAAAGRADRALIRQVNAYRADHGLDRVRWSRSLTRASRRHARRVARTGRPRHGRLRGHLRDYWRVGEVIEWHAGGPRPRVAVNSWDASRSHRRVLLDPELEYIGVGRAKGRVRGVRSTIWVARLGAD